MRDIDWEAAINARRSVRSYEMCPVEAVKMSMLQSFIGEMRVPSVGRSTDPKASTKANRLAEK